MGRSVASDIFLDDVTVSRSHARFVRTDSGRLAVQDVGSLNGTYVNHVRVEEKILDSGDEIQIGKFKLIYLRGEAPMTARARTTPSATSSRCCARTSRT